MFNTGLLLGSTFNNSTARFQQSPVHRKSYRNNTSEGKSHSLAGRDTSSHTFGVFKSSLLATSGNEKSFLRRHLQNTQLQITLTQDYDPFSLHKPNLFVSAQGECFIFHDEEEMHIQIAISRRCKPNNLLIKQTAHHHISKSHLLNNMGYIRALHITASKLRARILWPACCYSLFPTYGKLPNAWTEIALVFTLSSLKADL